MQFFVTDGFVSEDQKEEISSMINVKVSNDYFLVRINTLTFYNFQFNVRSGSARGKVEMLMLSYINDKFPSRVLEKVFLKEAKSFIAFLRGQSYAELLFHLEKDYKADEERIIETLYDETLQRLKNILELMK